MVPAVFILLAFLGSDPEKPLEIKIRGEVVCLAEEVERLHGVQIPPVHEHLTGIRTEDGRLFTLLKTSTSAFLFSDTRFRGRTLVLTGRTFPQSGLLEVRRTDWIREGKVYEVYYWCEICSIRTMDPGPCACCQGPVELRERPDGGGPEIRVPPAPDRSSDQRRQSDKSR